MAQSFKHPTLGFGSGHDLMVCGIEPRVGLYTDRTKPSWNILSLSLSINRHFKKLKAVHSFMNECIFVCFMPLANFQSTEMVDGDHFPRFLVASEGQTVLPPSLDHVGVTQILSPWLPF